MTLQRKRNLFSLLKQSFFQTPKNRIFPKGLTYAFSQKMPFFLYLDLVKTRLEIMLNDLAEKKKTFFGYKKQNFRSLRNHTFPKGLTVVFGQKMPIFFGLCIFREN